MPQILIVKGEGKGRIFEVRDEITVGRSSSNGIRINHTQVSRVHARIAKTADGWTVRDCQSRNGIAVNGKPVSEAALRAGDEIRVGASVLVFDPPFHIHRLEGADRAVILTEDRAPEGNVTAALDASDCVLAGEKAAGDPEALARANERLRKVFEIGRAIATLSEPDALAGTVLDLVMGALEADRGFILLREKPSGELKPAAIRGRDEEGTDIALSQTILQRVVRHRKSILSEDALDDPRFQNSESIKLAGVRSVLCVPLIVRDRVLGALYADKTRPYDAFTGEDLRFLTTVSHLAAASLENARAFATAQEENLELRERLRDKTRLVGSSRKMKEVLELCEKVAPADSTVFLQGETGTGKELVARTLHERSGRQKGPFVAVNCAAVPEGLLESELFGHEKGAFTGAHRRKIGRFEAAHGGTLFLDEVGEIPLLLQGKLLRALEEKRFERLGGLEEVAADARIVAATNRDLAAAAREGTFREDLYYRLAVVPVVLPPLRERPEDVEELIAFFLEEFNRSVGKSVRGFTPEALAALRAYSWPGNVRELRNLVERVVVLSDAPVAGLDALPPQVFEDGLRAKVRALPEEGLSLPRLVAEAEKLCIEKALRRAGGKKIEAARLLEISRPTLDKKLKAYGLE
jgi:transcriptional regulator with GAF, ATPase, and Fis domain